MTRATRATRFIDRDDDLRQFCADIAETKVIGLDTEFLRERTYRAQLCLIQIATADGQCACIDPLAIEDFSPLNDLLTQPGCIKILHAARQDIEVLYQTCGVIPTPLYDTQLAAALCGYGDQIGYGGLVEAVLQIRLDKGAARTDWSRRPLEARQLDYAAADVLYLPQLRERLQQQLRSQGRDEWLEEDFAQLTRVELYEPDDDHAWQRIRGAEQLRPKAFVLLQRLAAWREQAARDANLPRKWIAPDDVLTELARRAPRQQQQMSRIRNLPNDTLRIHGETLLGLIAQPIPESALRAPQKQPLTPNQEVQVDLLMAAARALSQREALPLASLTGRKEITRLVQGERRLNLLSGWRHIVAGRALLQLLAGELRIQLRDDELQLQPVSP